MARILITGSAGCLGQHLWQQAPPGHDLHLVWHQRPLPPEAPGQAHRLELADPAAVDRLFDRIRPELVLHTAYGNADMPRQIVAATANLAAAAARHGSRFLHMSTDCVFSGDEPLYAESAAPNPVFPYGEAKAQAEAALRRCLPDATLVRTGLIVALEPPNPSSGWIVDKLRAGQEVTLFADELRSTIAAPDLAAGFWELAAQPAAEAAGVWHLAGPETLSRYTLGLLLAVRLGLPTTLLQPRSRRSFPGRRPADLRLSCERARQRLALRPRALADFLYLGT